ncbi:MAG: IMP dehydrogenase [Alphaproteobacteria bacterium]|nr:IMP dehydrogenase [Alphaproteobacteria bacterium]MDA7983895.1 IMP dehydrogenase [Alphaproteobacteria bacterium]MDA7988472.1 IMP dehydrogenase [Alphaproteobacteria bacterium]MDA8010306.1 IMP dehydrogenase [Alphaproteobacteria bacterium]MDA8030755.1 IMP dehydrogenase [Alphaproteobacteria bacterium]
MNLPPQALTFDDILLEPQDSAVIPAQTSLNTRLHHDLPLHIPLISAAMDTVTESPMAIAMARAGGLGVVHKNLSADEQVRETLRVKRHEGLMVLSPSTIHPDAPLSRALKLMRDGNFSGLPVTDEKTGRLVGILTNRDVRFVDPEKIESYSVKDLMTAENVVTVKGAVSRKEARRLLHEHRIEKLPVVDDSHKCIGLITVKDIENARAHPNASKDSSGRLQVAAAVGVGDGERERAEELLGAGIDLLVLDSAHGHAQSVRQSLSTLKQRAGDVPVMAGNVATADGARALIDAGADIIKVGIGPGSICTTRVVAGVGMPQVEAIRACAGVCRENGRALVADGGIRSSGDIAKALALGADAVMVGMLLAGTDEAPGEVYLHHGRSYKGYRGMGSLGAMGRGSADRYFQQEFAGSVKYVPEGIEGQVPYRGPVSGTVLQLTGGVRAAMGYTGSRDLAALRERARFVRVTGAGLREGHPHDVSIVREAPNYPVTSY